MDYKFAYFANFNGGNYAVIRNMEHKKSEVINLFDIDCIEDNTILGGSTLKTKDKEYSLIESTELIEAMSLPDGFSWGKVLYKSNDLYDARSGWSGTDCYYRLVLNKDEKKILLSNPEMLLDKISKACNGEM